MKKLLAILCAISVALGSVAAYGQTTSAPSLTAKGLGKITLGMRKADIPAAIPGLYDKKVYEAASPDDMDFAGEGWYTCTLRGKETMSIIIGEKKVWGISVCTPKVKSADGISVGMPISRVKQLKGVRYETETMGEPFYYTVHGNEQIQYYDSFEGPETVRIMCIGMTY